MKALYILIMTLLCFGFACIAGAEDVGQSERFQAGDGVVLDTVTGLMWATRDNGSDIGWYAATSYCRDFSAAGYSDWRLPDIKELATLYFPDTMNRDGYFLADGIKISDCCMWSSYDTMGGALAFSFKTGKRPPAYLYDTYQLRALPVRGTIKKEAVDKTTTSFGGRRKVQP